MTPFCFGFLLIMNCTGTHSNLMANTIISISSDVAGKQNIMPLLQDQVKIDPRI